jgi:predicted transcriptional regulator
LKNVAQYEHGSESQNVRGWASVAELANVSNLSPHEVAAHLRTMKSVGLIEVQARRFSKGENVPASYRLRRPGHAKYD